MGLYKKNKGKKTGNVGMHLEGHRWDLGWENLGKLGFVGLGNEEKI